ncbi:HlyD family type I secretion periplasmic adaptor subunit [Caenispirillum bisanense]|uniref:HlyD family type I secretion periplasmic adaptor subunit n=1 Tax=Caenispirillum bisanense TaxID=414052 RepID=UPI0031D763D8
MTTAPALPLRSAAAAVSAVPAAPDETPPLPLRLRGPLLGGLAVVGAFVVGLGGWAATAPLASAVTASGALVVESNRKTVQHLEGGIVADILVRDGDHVRAGQPLLRLDETRARAGVRLLDHQIAALEAQAARLVAERDGAAAVTFPAALAEAAVTRPEAAEAMAVQARQFAERRQSMAAQVEILENRIDQLRQQRSGLEIERASVERQLTIFTDEIAGLRDLFRQGHTARTRILAIEREMAAQEGSIGRFVSDMARADQRIGETRLEILHLQQRFREEVVAELRDVRVQLADLHERKAVADDVMRRIVVTAPQDGIVQALAVHTVGGVVEPGRPILEIVPADDRLLIDARVSPMDIESIGAGQPAEVRFVALHDRTLPIIEAQVTRVSPDRLIDAATGQPYYAARLDLPAAELEKLSHRRLQAGMPVEVFIRTGDRTVLDYFLDPLTRSLDRALAVQ